MNRFLPGILLLAFGLSVSAVEAQDKAATPAEQYKALLGKFEATYRRFYDAKTDEERKAAVEGVAAFSPKFLDLAEKNAKDPIALQPCSMQSRRRMP